MGAVGRSWGVAGEVLRLKKVLMPLRMCVVDAVCVGVTGSHKKIRVWLSAGTALCLERCGNIPGQVTGT
jgi:hypothetical protein